MNNKVLHNATWIIGCRIIQAIMNLIISMISARYLGPSNYGLINYASSIAAFVLPLVQLGLRNTLVQEFVDNEGKEGEILGTSLLMCFASSILGIFGVIAFTNIANSGNYETIVVCMLYSISILFQITEMTQYWFQYKLLSKYTAITSLIAYIIVSIYKIFLLVTKKSIYWFALTNSIDYFIISGVLIIIYFKLGGQSLKFSNLRAKKLFSRSKYYIVSSMMVTIFAQTDKIMLKLMCGDSINGYYSAAITCAGMSSFVFVAIIDSMRPIILSAKKRESDEYQRNMRTLFSIIFYLGLLQSLVITIFAPVIIGILYGNEFTPTISIIRIITWYSAFSYLGSAKNIWILAENQQKDLLKINFVGASLNVIGNFALIPFIGAEGAAIASVMTQFFTNFILCFFIKSMKPCGVLMVESMNPNIMVELLKKIIHLR